jgi:hypothetical protein
MRPTESNHGKRKKERTMPEFEPITTQDQFDDRIKARLAREREKWEKGSDVEDLRVELSAKDEELATLKREHYLEDVERALAAELAARGVTDEGRIERTMKLVDMNAIEATEDGTPARDQVLSQLDGVAKDLPELVRPRGAGSGGSKRPVLEAEKPLTRDGLENMGPEEINTRWGQVKAFLAGERG